VYVWRIAADTPKYTADDLTGGGSKRTGGRWNPQGKAALYCSSSVSLACLETLVQVINDLPSNRYLVRLDIPPTLWKRAEIFPIKDPAFIGWDAEPAGMVSISYGQCWLAEERSTLLRVPSIIVPEEDNVVVNSGHPDASKIKSNKVRKINYDQRFRITKPRRVKTPR
jgi:RES domain-containing protein